MLDVLEIFRARFAGRPLLLSLVVLTLLLVASSRVSRSRFPFPSSSASRLSSLGAAIGILGLLAYLASAIWYASDPHFFDNAEPTMIAVGWLFHLGQPVYHALDSPERYAHIYGPMAFIVHGTVLAVLGPGIEVSKAVGVAAGAGSLALVHVALRSHLSNGRAVAVTGLYAVLLLTFRHYSFWTRPEPLQLLAVSASLLFAVRGRALASAIAFGIASGVLWNLKFTGPLYSLPLFVLLQRRVGWRAVIAGAATGAIVAALPFAAFGNVSLENYLDWLGLSARTGLLISTLRQNMEWALFFSLPLLLAFRSVPRDGPATDPTWPFTLAALFIGMSGVIVAAAKPGAGPYHLMPFLPVVAYLTAWRLSTLPAGAQIDPIVSRASVAFVVTAVAIALAQQAQLVTTMHARRGGSELQDIERFAGTHAGVIEMGYGTSEALTLERPALVFRNGTYFLDQPAIREHQLAGLEIPQATIDALRECRVNYWLVPKGETPFAGRNSYASVLLRPMFPASFRRAFADSHTRVETTEYFDVWRCTPRSAS